MRQLFARRGLSLSVNDYVADYGAVAVEFSSTVIATAFSILYSRTVNTGNSVVFVIIAAVVAYFTSAVLLKVLTAAMSAVTVCFVDSPDAPQVS